MKGFSLAVSVILAGLLFLPSPAFAKNECALSLGEVKGKPGDVVTCTIAVSAAPTGVAAFGMDVTVPDSLEYTGTCQPGELVAGFDQFGANQISDGVIRIGGFSTQNPIVQGASGNLATLEFTVKRCKNDSLEAVNLVDDIATWAVCDGDFSGK